MLDDKFLGLLITVIWMSGLFAIVLTVAHIVQERRKHWQPGYSWGMPRNLLPLYGSLALFCLGLALQAYAAERPLSMWITIVWALLAALCAGRALMVLVMGFRQGWNIQLDGQLSNLDSAGVAPKMRVPIWLTCTALLLLANLYFLARLGIAQVNAGSSAQQLENVAAPTVDLEATAISQPTASMTSVEVVTAATRLPVATATSVPTAIVATESVSTASAPTATPVITQSTPALTTQSITVSAVVQNAKGANLRKAPSLRGEIITVLDDATVVPVLGRTRDNEWFYVQLANGVRGWVSIEVVKPSNLIDMSPILEGE